jgi:hypothetical protein
MTLGGRKARAGGGGSAMEQEERPDELSSADRRLRLAKLRRKATELRAEYAAIWQDDHEGRLTLNDFLALIGSVMDETSAVMDEMRALVPEQSNSAYPDSN